MHRRAARADQASVIGLVWETGAAVQGASQDDFAAAFGFTINQIRDWEQGRARPLGGVRAYLLIIERDARSVLALLQKPRGKKAA